MIRVHEFTQNITPKHVKVSFCIKNMFFMIRVHEFTQNITPKLVKSVFLSFNKFESKIMSKYMNANHKKH